jgi:uncharacterized protein
MYLLNDLLPAQEALWEMLARKAVELLPLGLGDLPRIRELLRKYADRPMNLADAALIRVAEREGIRKIFTVDTDPRTLTTSRPNHDWTRYLELGVA